LLCAQYSSQWISLNLSNLIIDSNALASSMMFTTHIHAAECTLGSEANGPTVTLGGVHLFDIHSSATM
jgi:hypothetical protein